MISRFPRLFDTTATLDPIAWSDLFDEFSRAVTFRGDNDHPGWAPTEFEPAQRSLATVKRVHAIVLDYDNADPKTHELIPAPITVDAAALAWADFFGLIHTTRKHTDAWHRFRVILPYTRHVSPFEHTGIWYRMNAHAGGKLDPSPKDPSRFWYTPGCANVTGACFEARRLTGALFDPDEWLKRPDPTLSGQPLGGSIPINSSVRETRARAYLAHMPEAVSGQGGHSALWAAARKLIADFELDDEAAFRLLFTEYNPRCRPPWSEKEIRHKVKQARSRAQVKNPVDPDRERSSTTRKTYSTPYNPSPEQIAADREEADAPTPQALAAGDDVAPPTPAALPAPDPESWMRFLSLNAQGKLKKDAGNASLILRYDDEWRGCLEYDAFADQIQWARRPPEFGFGRPEIGERFVDHHQVMVNHWFSRARTMPLPKSAMWDAILDAARANTVHPLQDYFRSLVWDRKPRLSRILVDYLGAPDVDYTYAVGRWWMVSAVARAFQPGCQVDHVLILEGPQGSGKSTFGRILGGEYYLGSLPDLRDRERAAGALQGHHIIEVPELDAFRGAASTRVKEFVTQPFDDYRPPYGRSFVRRPRSCVFLGTTNEARYLHDPSGARRFWPIVVRLLARDALMRDRDQLWAEARIAYEAGEQWHPGEQLAAELAAEQDERFDEDEWLPRIAKWIRGGVLAPHRDGFTVGEVLEEAIGLEAGKWDRAAQTRAGSCLRRLGLTSRRETDGSARIRRYYASNQVGPNA